VKPHLVATIAGAGLLSLSVLLAHAQDKKGDGAAYERKNSDAYAELAKAPEKARNRINPLESDPDSVAAGRLLFEDHCAECHGKNAEGTKKAPSLRAPEVQTATSGTLFWVLTNGVVRKGMPVWSRLPEQQRWALVRYIKSLAIEQERTEPVRSKQSVSGGSGAQPTANGLP